MGQIIEMIRVQRFRQTIDGFANRLGFNPKVIEQVESGKGAHISKVFDKCIELGYIKNVKLELLMI